MSSTTDPSATDPGTTDHSGLTTLGPLDQLRAGRLGRRLPQLLGGLTLYGISMAMLIRAGLGLDPWDVLHQGLSHYVPLSFGTVTIALFTGVAED